MRLTQSQQVNFSMEHQDLGEHILISEIGILCNTFQAIGVTVCTLQEEL